MIMTTNTFKMLINIDVISVFSHQGSDAVVKVDMVNSQTGLGRVLFPPSGGILGLKGKFWSYLHRKMRRR